MFFTAYTKNDLTFDGYLNQDFPLWNHLKTGQVLFFLFFILIPLISSKVMDRIACARKRAMEKSGKATFFDRFLVGLTDPIKLMVWIFCLTIAITILTPEIIDTVVLKTMSVMLIINVVWLCFRATDVSVDIFSDTFDLEERPRLRSVFPMMNKAIKFIIMAIAFITVIQQFGYSATSLITGLGIGSAAIALASRDSLANIFGSVAIFFDNPFHVGDWIKVGDVEGIVEDVGFRTTKVRTFEKAVVYIPNMTIIDKNVENNSRREIRRVKMNIGVSYSTTAEQMEKTLEKIKNIILEHPRTVKDDYHAYFTDFEDSSLNIFIMYFVDNPDFVELNTTRQEINISIMKALEELGVNIPFPTRTIVMKKS